MTNTNFVDFISENHIELVKNLKKEKGKDIWLIGGGQINTLLFNAGLIDEIQLFVMPIVIPEWKDIFDNLPKEKKLQLIESKKYSTGAVEIRYKL